MRKTTMTLRPLTWFTCSAVEAARAVVVDAAAGELAESEAARPAEVTPEEPEPPALVDRTQGAPAAAVSAEAFP